MMRTPAEYYNLPVIGKLTTRPFFRGDKVETHDVIGFIDYPNRGRTYVVNKWYKEYNHTAQVFPEIFVEKFIPTDPDQDVPQFETAVHQIKEGDQDGDDGHK